MKDSIIIDKTKAPRRQTDTEVSFVFVALFWKEGMNYAYG
jgi:hypothetical protein